MIVSLCNIFINRSISQLLLFLTFAAAQNSTNEATNSKFSSVDGSMGRIILMCLLTAVFYVGLIFFCLRQFNCANQSAANIGQNGISCQITQPHGLDPAVIDSFPVLSFSSVKDLKVGNELLECAVCLGEFGDGETLRLLTKCGHVFHLDCISLWLSGHVTCPVCREKLTNDSIESSTELSTESSPEIARAELSAEESNQIAIDMNDDLNSGVPVRITVKEDRVPGRLSRSNSAGHSLIQPGEGSRTLRRD